MIVAAATSSAPAVTVPGYRRRISKPPYVAASDVADATATARDRIVSRVRRGRETGLPAAAVIIRDAHGTGAARGGRRSFVDDGFGDDQSEGRGEREGSASMRGAGRRGSDDAPCTPHPGGGADRCRIDHELAPRPAGPDQETADGLELAGKFSVCRKRARWTALRATTRSTWHEVTMLGFAERSAMRPVL